MACVELLALHVGTSHSSVMIAVFTEDAMIMIFAVLVMVFSRGVVSLCPLVSTVMDMTAHKGATLTHV